METGCTVRLLEYGLGRGWKGIGTSLMNLPEIWQNERMKDY